MTANTQHVSVTRRSVVALAASAAFAGLGLFAFVSAPAAFASADASAPAIAGAPDASTAEPYVVQESAGTRIVTPCYSILIPSERLGEGTFEYRYLGQTATEDGGMVDSHATTVNLYYTDGTFEWFQVSCSDPQAGPAEGGMGFALAGGTDPEGREIVVFCYPSTTALGRWEEATARAQSWAEYVTPAVSSVSLDDLVYAVEEELGTRVVTPFYSVLVPAELIEGEVTYSYGEVLPALTSEATNAYYSHNLTVGYGSGGFTIRCYDPALNTLVRDMGCCPSEALTSDGLSMAVLVYIDPSTGATWEEAGERAALFAQLIEPVEAPEWAGVPNVEKIELDDSLLVKTPWYSIEVPNGLRGPAFEASYREGLPAAYASLGNQFPSHVLFGVLDANTPEARELFEVRCLQPEDASALEGAYHVVPADVTAADGLNVYVMVLKAYDPEENAEREARAKRLAALVTSETTAAGDEEASPAI